jgi:hypothetical protein
MNLVVLIIPFFVYCVKMYVYKLNMRDKICLFAYGIVFLLLVLIYLIMSYYFVVNVIKCFYFFLFFLYYIYITHVNNLPLGARKPQRFTNIYNEQYN